MAELTRLVAEGRSHAHIAAIFGCSLLAVKNAAIKFGVRGRRFNLAALRSKIYRDRARASGWPEDLRWRSVQMLNCLWDRGPMTRRQLADAIGMPWKGSRKSLVSNDPEGSYLAHLMRRGLVTTIGRVVRGQGKGHNTFLYMIPLHVERGKEQA